MKKIEDLFRESVQNEETAWTEHGHTKLETAQIDAEHAQISFSAESTDRAGPQTLVVVAILWLAGAVLLFLALKNFLTP